MPHLQTNSCSAPDKRQKAKAFSVSVIIPSIPESFLRQMGVLTSPQIDLLTKLILVLRPTLQYSNMNVCVHVHGRVCVHAHTCMGMSPPCTCVCMCVNLQSYPRPLLWWEGQRLHLFQEKGSEDYPLKKTLDAAYPQMWPTKGTCSINDGSNCGLGSLVLLEILVSSLWKDGNTLTLNKNVHTHMLTYLNT